MKKIIDIEHKKIIEKLRLMSQNEYLFIYNKIINKVPCNFLIFGVGFDSELWMDINKNGETVFLEDKFYWICVCKKKYSHIDIIKIKYNTIEANAFKMLEQYKKGEKLIFNVDIPQRILDTTWDLIFVDAPRGSEKSCSEFSPGRMKSIYYAHKLALNSKNCTVIIHDCHRKVEKVYCDYFMGNNFEELEKLRKYEY